MTYLLFYTALMLAIITDNVSGFSNGAPSIACSNGLLPLHGRFSQFSPSTRFLPFTVNTTEFVDQTYIPNQLYTIILHGQSSNPTFRGFMIQGRTVASDSPAGVFLPNGSQYRPLCNGPNGNTAAAHTNRNEKFIVFLLWRAPPPGTGTIRFRFSFVDSFSLFWVNNTEEIFEANTTSTGVFPSTFFSSPTSTSTRFFSTSTRIFPTTTSFFPTSTSFFPTSTTFSSFVSTVIPTSTPTGPPSSCAQLTGYPPCSPEFCYGKDTLTRCSVTVDTCTERCQVTICGACFYINRPTNARQCPRRSYCKDFRCLQQWINCTYKKTVQSQFICMIAAAADPIRAGGLKLPYGKGGLASDLFTIL